MARISTSPGVVLVTGAAGFIGSHLTRHLICSGSEVIGVDNEQAGDWTRVDAGVVRVDADISELTESEWRKLCTGVDVVFHLAAEKYNSSRMSPERVVQTNIVATGRLFGAAAVAGVRKVVFTSSLYAYGSLGPEPMREQDQLKPTTYYGMSKVAGENLLRVAQRDHGLNWAVARLLFVYGPKQWAEGGYKSVILRNFERILAGDAPVVNGDGLQALDYVYVDDVVRALIELARPDHDGLVCNIASGHAYTVRELTLRMCEVAGVPFEPAFGRADWTAGTRRFGDPSLATETMGWSAQTSMATGLASVWNWIAGER